MKFIKFIITTIVRLIKIIIYEWFIAGKEMLTSFWEKLQASRNLRKQSHAERNESLYNCLPVDHPSFQRPDPCIYSQHYLLKQGLGVTWDNPDIVLRKDGVIVPRDELLADTEYEIDARIWNNSFTAPIVGLPVEFHYLDFGIGTSPIPIGSTSIILGVKGGQNHPAHAKYLWRTPPSPGHYCIQVKFSWDDDINPENNLGQENVNLAIAQSPANFTFKLKNDTNQRKTYTLEMDSYSLPTLEECEDAKQFLPKTRAEKEERLVSVRALHNRNNFPVPSGWDVEIIPEKKSLDPAEEIFVEVNISPPTGFIGTKSFNINGFCEGKFEGGVTLYVSKE